MNLVKSSEDGGKRRVQIISGGYAQRKLMQLGKRFDLPLQPALAALEPAA